MTGDARVIEGDCLDVLRTLPDGCVDAVVTDPPYPHVRRAYGHWTEEEWVALMDPLVEECRRLLTPKGSAVFVLQPNSERAGRLRPWLWEFMARWSRRWNLVQDAWWWNTSAMPLGGATEEGLLRPSLKACVWLGPPDCRRDQAAVLWSESDGNAADRLAGRLAPTPAPARRRSDTEGPRDGSGRLRTAAARRGGVTPFNVLPVGGGGGGGGLHRGHPAGTPLRLCRWWVRYLCPPGGLVLDPFAGSGTVPVAALREGRRAVGVERLPEYCEIARRRIDAELAKSPLFTDGVPA